MCLGSLNGVRSWDLEVSVDVADGQPLFVQISRQVVAAILDGRLPPGSALPGTRSFATRLGVHRNTVLAAYDELVAEGWVTTSPTRGTFVSEDLSHIPRVGPSRRPAGHSELPIGFDLPGPAPYPLPPEYGHGHLVLTKGAPDTRLFPRAELARACRRVLDRPGDAMLTYGDPRGDLGLRTAIADMLASRRGLPGGPETVLISSGSQMAVLLLITGLLAPGDAIAVEELSSPGLITAMRERGLRVVPVPLDEHGMRVDELAQLADRYDVRAVSLTPHHQFPTTTVMASARRLALLEVARSHRLVVIEDDYDHEYHYEGRPILPMASMDPTGNVVYAGTLSKVLGPGLRIGYLRAAPAVIDRLASIRALVDIQGNQIVEAAVAVLFESGEIGRHLRRSVRVYRRRRDVMLAAIADRLGDVLRVQKPAGGMALWAEVDPSVDLPGWCARAAAYGVFFQPGGVFSTTGNPVSATRLGFTYHDEAELTEAVERMRAALPGRRGRVTG